MKTHLTLLLAAVLAALSLPSCVIDGDDDVRPVTTTTVTEETRPGYTYNYSSPSSTVSVAPRTYRYPNSVTVNPQTTTTRTTRTTYLREED